MLSAILSADVKGYSVLMADDEVHTIETLKSYRQIISNLVSEHSGRVVDSPGDNILAEFQDPDFSLSWFPVSLGHEFVPSVPIFASLTK